MSNFLFPIETSARELDHKILMALSALDENRTIYIGDQQYIRNLSHFISGGVFYGKHLFGKPQFSDRKYYDRLKKRNFNVVHLNEEGAVWPGKEKVWENLLRQAERPSVLSDSDFMTVWGEWQKSFNDSYEKHNTNIVVTGHPRFDLYQQRYLRYYKDDIEQIKEKYGDFILVNTAFSFANNGMGGVKFIFRPTLSYDVSNSEQRNYRFKRWRTQMVSVADLVLLINEISEQYPETNIVLRPHPSENSDYYKEIFQNIKNVHVVYSGSVNSWILACRLLIHNGCTTAIEATLAGKNVLNYCSQIDEDFDIYLANICGVTITEQSKAMEFVANALIGKADASVPSDTKSTSLFQNFKDDNTAKNVTDVLNRAAGLVDKSEISSFSSARLVAVGLLHRLYLWVKYTYLTLKGKGQHRRDYNKRFEKFDRSLIEKKVKDMSNILGIEAEVGFLNKYVFTVTKKKVK